MAKASVELILVLRKAADNLQQTNDYMWQHMNSCDCNFLMREITILQQDEIHKLIAFGFDIDDLKHLQHLSDDAILSSLPVEERNLHPHIKHDVIKYIRAWATLLENKLLDDIYLPQCIINTETIL